MLMRALGVPWMYRRFVAVYVNGTRRGKLMEDAYRASAGAAEDQYFSGDTGGQFYKIQRWYEGSSTTLNSECRLQQYTTTGGAKKTARYRPVWALKDTTTSLSDFTNVYTLIAAANAYNQANYLADNSLGALLLLGLGAFFVLFYTFPLKYIALGEIAVLVVWGPLMIGGGYYVLAHRWDWNVVIASLPYVLGVTTVIFGKHIDKLSIDKAKRIFTVPVLLGERAARYAVLSMMILPYLITAYLIATRFFTPVMLLVLLAIPTFVKTYPAFLKPKPAVRPEGFADGQGGWPLYFAPLGFVNNRAFGMYFLLGLMLDTALRLLPATANFWR